MITQKQVEKLKAQYAAQEAQGKAQAENGSGSARLNVSTYLAAHGVDHAMKVNGSKTLFTLTHCLFNPDHGPNESSIGQGADGKLFYQCFHSGCKGRTWRDARQIISGDDSLAQFMDGGAFSQGSKIDQSPPSKRDAPEWTPDDRPFLKSWGEIYGAQITVEYLVDRLLPKNAITVLFGRGGIGKTWLALDLARCIGGGVPFLGLDTKQTPVVYVDFENPLAVLNSRTQKLGEAEGVFFWLANDETKKAPKLDSPEWVEYKNLPEGAVLIFDTLRASQSKDEDKSQDMASVLSRLKELRDMGFTVILLHHTAKNNDRVAKGSTAIVDLADHILGLTLVKKKADGKDQVINDDDDDQDDAVYRFGWREKTRFEPFHLYLTLDSDRGFDLAPDPQERTLELMAEISEDLGPCSKSAFYEACKKTIGMGEKKVRRLLTLGDGRFWYVKKAAGKNTYTVEPKTAPNSKSATGPADLKTAANSKTATDIADLSHLNTEKQAEIVDLIKKGNPEEVFCRFADLDPLGGVI